MAERFVSPFARFFTSDLKTLPGALLYFYENGTTTLKPVYQDPFKNTAHANPVVAGTLGAAADTFPPIFLDGTYTVELRNSAGVVQGGWPQNNVGGEQIQGQLDDYSAITSYTIGELVTGSDGNRYESTANNNLNNDPTILANRPEYWKQIYIIGEYNSSEPYESGEYVTFDGGLFKCTQNGTGNNPNTAHAFWQRIHNIPHWGASTAYRTYDYIIDAAGNLQKAAANSTGSNPTTPSTNWSQVNEEFAWNSARTYAAGAIVWRSGYRYFSQQNTNLNNDPATDTAFVWWKPEWATQDVFAKVKWLSGGGNLTPYFENVLTDSLTYIIPLANSVPARAHLLVSKNDANRTGTPTIQTSGGNTLTWSGAPDTSLQMLTTKREVYKLVSDGISIWRIV